MAGLDMIDQYFAAAMARATPIKWSFVQEWPEFGALARLGLYESSTHPDKLRVVEVIK